MFHLDSIAPRPAPPRAFQRLKTLLERDFTVDVVDVNDLAFSQVCMYMRVHVVLSYRWVDFTAFKTSGVSE